MIQVLGLMPCIAELQRKEIEKTSILKLMYDRVYNAHVYMCEWEAQRCCSSRKAHFVSWGRISLWDPASFSSSYQWVYYGM